VDRPAPGVVTDQLRVRVITVSTRAAAGEYADRSGPEAVAALRKLGHEVDDAVVVSDGAPLASLLAVEVTAGWDVIVTTGGTGLAPDDQTPEVTRALLEREVPGVAEAIRAQGMAAGIDTAALSRGLCGVTGRTLLVNLPGSVGVVRDGIAVLAPILPHAIQQLGGGDH
jgi:molybdenum cofactor synthesis domain-containing protein